MVAAVRIRITRPCLVRGQPLPAGQVVDLAPADAVLVTLAGRGEPADAAAAAACEAERARQRAEVERHLRTVPRSRVAPLRDAA